MLHGMGVYVPVSLGESVEGAPLALGCPHFNSLGCAELLCGLLNHQGNLIGFLDALQVFPAAFTAALLA